MEHLQFHDRESYEPKEVLDNLSNCQGQPRELDRYTRETQWLAANRDRFRGLWIALDGDILLAQAKTAKEVFATVAGRSTPPLVIQIPVDDLPFGGW